MDYALQVVQRWSHESAEETAERAKAGEEQAPDPAEIRRMGSVLHAALPSLVKTDAPKGWRLTHAGSGARIAMQGDEFRIQVPRTHAVATARTVWSDLWIVLRTLDAEGYAAYDPQLDRILNMDQDQDAVVKEYVGSEQPSERAPEAVAPARPWWKLW
jgi:hypothetical protein